MCKSGFFPDITKTASSLQLNLASPINAGAIAMLFGLIIVPIVSAFTKNKNIETDAKLIEECRKQAD